MSKRPLSDPEFLRALANCINKHGVDGYLGLPDYAIADMLIKHLEDLRVILKVFQDSHSYDSCTCEMCNPQGLCLN